MPADREGKARRYLTDGVHLQRFLGCIAGCAGRLAGIEICRSLGIMLVAIEQLRSRRLRVVISAN
jgi:hypothetical protein